MNAQTLQRAMPGLGANEAARLVKGCNEAMIRGKITTAKRAACFLAQVGHESVSLRYRAEIGGSSARYAPYYGRTFIQITWKSGYQAFGRWLGVGEKFVNTPSLLERDEYVWLGPIWYWSTNDLNRYADRDDFEGLTRAINGGLNGYEDRKQRWARIKQLGDAILPAEDPYSFLTDKDARLIKTSLKIRADARARGKWLVAETARVKSIEVYLRAKITALKAKRSLSERERKRLGYLRDGVAGRQLR